MLLPRKVQIKVYFSTIFLDENILIIKKKKKKKKKRIFIHKCHSMVQNWFQKYPKYMNLAPEMLKLVSHVLVAKPFWPPFFGFQTFCFLASFFLSNSFNQSISEHYENSNFTYPSLLKAVLLKYC